MDIKPSDDQFSISLY